MSLKIASSCANRITKTIKLVITKFSFFYLQTLNSNFRLSESRALAMSTDNKNLEEFLLINKTNLFKVRPVQTRFSNTFSCCCCFLMVEDSYANRSVFIRIIGNGVVTKNEDRKALFF